jgi:hypothetical protein
MLQRIAALPAAVALLLLLVVPAMAGGWAEVRADATTTTTPPVEGQPMEIGFTVLQHGETPAGWVTPTVHFYHLGTGATIDAPATSSGPDGHFVATVRPDQAGYWGWTVTFPELVSDPTAVTIAVHHRDGTAPAFDPAAAVTAVAVARASVRQEVLDAMYLEVERLTGQLQAQRDSVDRLQAEVDTLTTAQGGPGAADTAGAAAETAPSTTVLVGVVLLAILAGGAAGFLMAWLGGRNGPRETDVALSPAPR